MNMCLLIYLFIGVSIYSFVYVWICPVHVIQIFIDFLNESLIGYSFIPGSIHQFVLFAIIQAFTHAWNEPFNYPLCN